MANISEIEVNCCENCPFCHIVKYDTDSECYLQDKGYLDFIDKYGTDVDCPLKNEDKEILVKYKAPNR